MIQLRTLALLGAAWVFALAIPSSALRAADAADPDGPTEEEAPVEAEAAAETTDEEAPPAEEEAEEEGEDPDAPDQEEGIAVTLPAGPPDGVLPSGYFAHVQIANLGAFVEAVDKLAYRFVPDNWLMGPLAQAKDAPQKVLALLALMDGEKPVSIRELAAFSGINPDGRVSITYYPPQGRGGGLAWVLSVPVGNRRQALQILEQPIRQALIEMEAYRYLEDPLVVRASPDALYYCDSEATAEMLSRGGTDLKQDKAYQAFQKAYGDKDLSIFLAPGPLKMQFPFIAPALVSGVQEVAEVIRRGVRRMPARQRMQTELRLRLEFGIRDFDQAIDYYEAYAKGSAETLVQVLHAELVNLDGFGMAADLEGVVKRVRFCALSKSIRAEDYPAALTPETLAKALALTPGDQDYVTIQGKSPAPKSSVWLRKWIQLCEAELKNKALPMEGFNAFKAYVAAAKDTPPLSARAPWVATTYYAPAADDFEMPDTFDALVARIREAAAEPTPGSLMVLPAEAGPEAAKAYFKELAANRGNNQKAWMTFLTTVSNDRPLFLESGRYFEKALEGGAEKLTYESVYTSRFGLFGYTEHEWINRQVLVMRPMGEAIYLQAGHADDSWIAKGEEPRLGQAAPAVADFLNMGVETPYFASCLRLADLPVQLVDGLGLLEDALRGEMDAYLAKVEKAVAAAGGDWGKAREMILGMEMPFLAAALCRDEETNKAFVMLPGNLRYPRPKVMPLADNLIADYREKAPAMGGMGIFLRAEDGMAEMVWVQRMDALATLVRTVGNRAFSEYVATPDGQAALTRTLVVPGDRQPVAEENQVLSNPIWEFLEQGDFAPIERGLDMGGDEPMDFDEVPF